MKIIKNVIEIPVQENTILLNGNTGTVVQLNKEEYVAFKKYQDETAKICNNDCLIEELIKLGFVVANEYDEEATRYNIIEKSSDSLSGPKTAVIVLTYACNFGCPYCYENDVKNCASEIISFSQIDSIMELCGEEVKHFTLFGGEPLLPITRDVITYLSKKYGNKEYAIVTNGYYLAEYIDILKKMKISYVQVTLDGDESIHNKTRILKNGGPTFAKIFEGIEACLHNEITVKIRMNVNLLNIDNCYAFRERIIQKYSDYKSKLIFEISPIFQTGGCEYNELVKTIYSDIKSAANGERSRVNYHMLTDLPIVNYLLGDGKLRPLSRYCLAHGEKLIFDPFGDIYSCILGVGDKRTAIGSYYPEYHMFEKSIFTRNLNQINECMECAKALFCGGGCPLELIKQGKDIYSPNCTKMNFTKEVLLPYLLENL